MWTTEAGDFTPWLAGADNLSLLGDTVGLELELEAQEKDVGPFRADILCKDTAPDAWVLIENQLERTDHDSRIKATKPLPQHWMNIAVGRSGFRIAAIAAFFDSVAKSYDSHELRAELLMDDTNSKTYYAMLEEMKPEIETELGESLSWHNPPNARMCRLSATQSHSDQITSAFVFPLQRLTRRDNPQAISRHQISEDAMVEVPAKR